MAHEIEGNKAFFVGQKAWHGIGHVLNDAPTTEEAWRMAYPHTLFKLDVEAKIIGNDGSVHTMPCNLTKAIFRDDGKELGSVGADFELVQPWEVFKQFEPLIDKGLIKLEAGGSLRDGRQMWALGKVQGCESDILPGDPIEGYMLMATGFEGSMRVFGGLKNERVVCANTLEMALNEKERSTDIKLKHTKNVRYKLNAATDLIGQTIDNFKKSVEQYRFLANKRLNHIEQMDVITRTFLTDKELKDPEEVSERKSNIVKEVIDLLDTQKGLELVPAARGTAWQAYNAVTEYTTHRYGRNEDTRLQAQWFGESQKISQKALSLALHA